MKAHQAMLASLKVGDRVILASGFAGKITKIEERFFTVEIARNVDVQVERNAVAQKLDA